MWRARPVFISSTFLDMQAERDYLRTRVFPELEEKLRTRRHNLEWVDLRVGVATAAERDERARELHVLKVCLAEVKRCRPFLIVLLGDRYGWAPPEDRVRAAAAEEGFSTDIAGRSITDLEIDFGVLSDPEQQPRSIFYLRDPLPYRDMPPQLAALFSNDYERDPKDQGKPDPGAADRVRRLAMLKQRIETQLPTRVRRYTAQWDAEHQRVTGLEQWGRMVLEDIWSELEAETRVAAVEADIPWQQAERDAMEDFTEDRARDFVGRREILERLTDLAVSPARAGASWAACITGHPGSGKSALFGELYRRLSKTDALLLGHAAGASLQSAAPDSMLRRWIDQLATALGTDPGLQENADPDAVDAAFASLLGRMAQQQRVILLVDALDQFEPTTRGRYLTWLPQLWPDNARLIATTTSGEASNALVERGRVEAISLPPIDAKDARSIIEKICGRYHREFEPEVTAALLARTGVDGAPWTNPLWLVLAVEDLNLLDADDFARARTYAGTPSEQLRALMLDQIMSFPAEIPGLYGHTFDRAEELFGIKLTRGFLGLIAISRAGWRESDFRTLLPRVGGESWDTLQFACLRRFFRGQMRRRNALGQWDFHHAQMRAAVLSRLAAQDISKQSYHAIIADHLLSCRLEDPLHLSETMFHLLGSEDWERASGFYGNPSLTNKECDGATRVLADRLLAREGDDDLFGLQSVLRLLDVAELNAKPDAAVLIAHRLVFNLDPILADRTGIGIRVALLRRVRQALAALVASSPDSLDWNRDLAIVNERIGHLLRDQGSLSEALASFRSSEAILARLVKIDSGNATLVADYVACYESIAGVLRDQGDLLEAIRIYRNSQQIIEICIAEFPESVYWQRELSSSHNNIGAALKAQGNLSGALENYQASLAIRERLAAADPSDPESQHALAEVHSAIAVAFMAQGHLLQGLSSFRRSEAISLRLVAADPRNTRWRWNLTQDHHKIGDALLAGSELSEALTTFQKSLAILDELAKSDPGNTTWQRDCEQAHSRIGDTLLALGGVGVGYAGGTLLQERLEEALNSYRLGLAIAQGLAESDTSNAERQRDLAVLHTKIGDVHLAQQNAEKAMHCYRLSLALRKRLAEVNVTSVDRQRDLLLGHSKVGDALAFLTDSAAALQSYEAALAIAEALAKANDSNTALQVDAAICGAQVARLLLMVERDDEALATFQRVRARLAPLVAASPGQAVWTRYLTAIDEQIAKLQVTKGAMTEGDEALIEAATAEDAKLALPLIKLRKAGRDLNFTTSAGLAPLHIAAASGREALVRLLIKWGAKLDIRTSKTLEHVKKSDEGMTALHIAVQMGHHDVAQLLLESGAVIEAATKNGITPLHLAAQNGDECLVRLLVGKGASVSALDDLDLTPLDYFLALRPRGGAVATLLGEKSARFGPR